MNLEIGISACLKFVTFCSMNFELYILPAWDMVFKAVQGVVPAQGGLRQLWKSSDTLNSDNPSAQTLTRSPGLVYKSANVEKWQSIPGFFIESVIFFLTYS